MTEKTILYNSKLKNLDTLLDIKSGDKISVIVKIKEPWKDWVIPSSLEGFNNCLAFLFPPRWKSQKYYCLCACIGENEDYFFKIGIGLTELEIKKSGRLYIFVNDYEKEMSYANNKGLVELVFRIS